jgi:hypothetical protein
MENSKHETTMAILMRNEFPKILLKIFLINLLVFIESLFQLELLLVNKSHTGFITVLFHNWH